MSEDTDRLDLRLKVAESPDKTAETADEQDSSVLGILMICGDDSDDGADAATTFPRQRPSAADALADACLKAALSNALRRRIVRRGIAVVIEVPGADWVDPIERAVGRLDVVARVIARDGSKRADHKPEKGCGAVADSLSGGGSIIGISQSPASYLPSALMTVADAHIVVKAPRAAVLRRILSAVLGRAPRKVPNAAASGLSFNEIVAAFRQNAGASQVLQNLAASTVTKSKVSATDDTPTLHDLPGYDGEPRDWAMKLVDDMAAWSAGKIRWRDVSASAVLHGPPGTGKTLFAKSVGRTLGMPIIATSCNEWLKGDIHLGTMIAAMSASFDSARALAPCVLFIDELEGIPSRKLMSPRGRDWWTPVVNHALTMLDGAVTARDGVIIIGATNHPDQLDEALIRPGRLDRLLAILPPGPDTLAKVMRYHLRGALPEADLIPVARLVPPGSTPADAAQWIRDAAGAARAAGRDISLDDLIAVVAPPEDRPVDTLRVIATHESGHAVGYLSAGRRVDALSLIKRGPIGGGTHLGPAMSSLIRRSDVEAEVVGLLCGRAAEEVIHGAVSAGATADLAEATRIIAAAHGAQGLGASLIHRGDPVAQLAYDRDLRSVVDADLRRLYGRALTLIRRRRADVETIADALVERRFLTCDEVAGILATPKKSRKPTSTTGRANP